ncbi:MAG: hypothetical protein ABS30_08025 [OM182 bacterium BACL3 MAG-120924-bin41]|uniref:DUF2868 domain-containing protein n=1 Tax=OM182 bacterium BACL3 MAG-120924-bin41 TaxID=1655632 RepID=A0A0R2WU57_9GAMM|nr:MAG: hypothetical protein ABS30_08025 [OM182 bacterium BACL3 MAG-120924-bin41]
MQKNEHFLGLRSHSVALGLIALMLGLLASVAVLRGDDFGRVNLLSSLSLFALLPSIGLVVTLLLLFLGRRSGIAALLIELPLAPKTLTSLLLTQRNGVRRQTALFSLSQSLVLAFATGNLLGFVLMLLATDVSFVWRSTLLDAATLFPILDTLASPWRWWQAAQPSLEMLNQTQDFRLQGASLEGNYVGQWWQYLLAAQLCYSIVPRALLWLFANNKFKRAAQLQDSEQDPSHQLAVVTPAPESDKLAASVSEIPANAVLFDCAHTSDALLSKIEKSLRVSASYKAPTSFDFTLDGISPTSTPSFVVVVRSWEPPLAELADSILAAFTAEQRQNLFIAPIDWESNQQQGDHLIQPTVAHTQEWRRFCESALGCTHLALFEAQV